jgi:RNA polymerase sigma-70 factor (ECF subfamily)
MMLGAGASAAVAGEPVRAASDEELARRAREGSRDAFSALVQRFERPLLRFLCIRTGRVEDSEELVQETFLRAWHNLERYDPTRRFATWLYTIAKRLAISHQRRERGALLGAEALAEHPGAEPDPQSSASEREESLELWSLAARVLGQEERSALWLRYGEDLTPAEIAQVLGRRQVTVRVLLFRAREKLARGFESPETDTQGMVGGPR